MLELIYGSYSSLIYRKAILTIHIILFRHKSPSYLGPLDIDIRTKLFQFDYLTSCCRLESNSA